MSFESPPPHVRDRLFHDDIEQRIPCPICGQRSWALAGNYALFRLDDEGYYYTAGGQAPVRGFLCTSCSYLLLFPDVMMIARQGPSTRPA